MARGWYTERIKSGEMGTVEVERECSNACGKKDL